MKYLILELILCFLHSPPFVNKIFFIPNAKDDIPYSLDIILTICTTMRLYLLYRVFLGTSFWSDERVQKVSRELSNAHGGASFTLKAEIKERPFSVILFTLVILIFVLGFFIRAAEL